MKIKDILDVKGFDVYTLDPDDKICNAINEFSKRKIGSAVIVDKLGGITGIFTERDALHCFKEKLDFKTTPVKQMMTPQEDLIVASLDDDIQYVMSMMTEHRIKHIPIIAEGRLAGIVSIGDVVKAQMVESKQITKKYMDFINDIPHPENEEY